MSKMTKIISVITLSTIMATSFVGCGSKAGSGSKGDTVNVSFWTAPQKVQFDYWTKKTQEFNKTNTKVNGKVVKMEIQQMPETPSSEATIQISINYCCMPGKQEPTFVRLAVLQNPPHKWHGFRIFAHNPEVAGSSPAPATFHEP